MEVISAVVDIWRLKFCSYQNSQPMGDGMDEFKENGTTMGRYLIAVMSDNVFGTTGSAI